MNHNLKSTAVAGLLFSGIFCSAFAEPVVKYSEVEFDLSLVTIQELGDLGLPVDHHDGNGKGLLTMPVSQYDIEALKAHKIPYTVLVDDAAKAIEQRNIALAKSAAAQEPLSAAPPANYKHGTMGGYLTYAEIVKEIDEMRTKFPNFVSAKFSVGTSVEGRTLWAIRISNNPNVEQNKRRIVYNTLTHPREPMAVMSMMWFLWNAFENYNTDAAIKSCIDNVELYYIPVVNPDGFEYNRSTNPSGGGLWRKNRATNSDGSRGVDINRNYSVNWGNNAGSSGTTTADTYRGPTSFSEPESKTVRDFYLAKKFIISSNFHTYANKLLHPYGLGALPANLAQYQALAKEMTRVNGWQYGEVPPTIGYSAAGIEIDWAHDVAKNLAVNPEQALASDGGFWPPETRIDALALQALDMNLAMCRFAQTIPVPVQPRAITSDFSLDLNAARGQWNVNYRLTDAQRSWTVNVYDMQGKRHKHFALNPNESSFTLSRADLPRSLGLLEVTACGRGGCESVYKQKLMMGGF